MKQQIIELKKKLLLVELPEGADRLKVFNDEQPGEPYLSYFKGHSALRFYLSSKCLLIGKLTVIKEEEFRHLVESVDYNGANLYWNAMKERYGLTAKESFFSKLEAEEITFNRFSAKTSRGALITQGFTLGQQQEAQEKVWNLDNCYVFEIL